MPRVVPAVAGLLVVVGCVSLSACTSGSDRSAPAPAPPRSSTAPPSSSTPSPPSPSSPSTSTPAFDPAAAMGLVREIAAVGPREATSPEYREGARIVTERLTQLGYAVEQQSFRVPAGESWGIRVGAGRSFNVVARTPGAVAGGPHVLVGAHLDTVPQAPGAEDNASGVAVLLGTAELAARAGTRLPVTFVAFGAEEPRGPGDDEHHFGSQAYVRRIASSGTAEPVAMVSLDRVGTRGRVPVCTGGLSPPRVQRQLLAAAERAGVPARACENRTSDHWPFEKAGGTVARLGGNDYAAYHSALDLPRVVDRRQLGRVGRVLWEWLSPTEWTLAPATRRTSGVSASKGSSGAG